MSEGEWGYIIETQVRPCYKIYVTLSIVVYSIAHSYPGITTLLCGKKLPHLSYVSAYEENVKWPEMPVISL